jgi:flavin reductase (DIM6/NTAB) family NADH-FMN oxidoreductase RutF
MIIDFNSTPPLTRYHFMTQTILPRPIAWVLSVNSDDSLNLAPFSFFNAVCSDPPLLLLSIGSKSDGSIKDTRLNIVSGRPFVIHIASVDQSQIVNNSAAELAYGESELAREQLPLAEFPGCSVPRLRDCHVAYHCLLHEVHEIGPNKQAMVYAEIKQLYLSDEVVEENNGRYVIDAQKINPLARLGGTSYAKLGEVFSLVRP